MKVAQLGILASSRRLIGSFDELLAMMPPERYASNPVVARGATYTNICPAGWIIDPADSSKFLLYVGEFIGNTRSGARLTVYRGNISDPFTVSYVQVVITAGASGAFDDNGAAFGNVIKVGSTYYLYYGAQKVSSLEESIGVATSTDGLNWTKQGQAIAPLATNADRGLTDPYVVYESGVFYMYMTRKEGTAANNCLPTGGLIVATSNDGLTFTRTGTVAVTLGASDEADGKFIEGGQVYKYGNDYVLLYTACGKSDTWSIMMGRADGINMAFTKESYPVFQHSLAGTYDAKSVAVPLLVDCGGQLVLYYQGSSQFQPASLWDLCAASVGNVDDTPAGYLVDGTNGWSGNMVTFDVSGEVTLAGSRSLRGLSNNGAVGITHAIDVVPGASASCRIKLRCSALGAFRGGFYIMEGANVITGVYFNNTVFSYLKNTGWTNLVGVANNTTYDVEVLLINNTQHTIKVDGVTRATAQTNFTAITTKANIIKLEKDQANNTSIVYFDDIICTDGTNTFTENFENAP